MSLTKEQLEQRLDKITGSDASVICGVSKWQTPYELWQIKTRRLVAKDISDNPSVKAGTMLEPSIRNWFASDTGKHVEVKDDMLIHPKHDWMAANIDGWIPKEKAVLEIKTSQSDKGWGEDGENIIPDYYRLQVAHYMAVTNAKKAYVVLLLRGFDYRVYTIERDLELEKELIRLEQEFWHKVQDDIEPEFTNSSDVILHYANKDKPEPIVADDFVQSQVEQLAFLKQQEADIKKDIKATQDIICTYMRDHDSLVAPSGDVSVTWKKSKDSEVFDAKKFQEENESLYKKYLKPKEGTRRFLLKHKSK